MLRHLGYACICLSLPDSSPRGTILRHATPERLRALIAENLRRLDLVLRFNAEHDIRLFRISSDIIPFGSHPANQVPWWDEFRPALEQIGALVRADGMRVSMHPGQYTVLSATAPAVLDATRRDLAYHARFLDALGLDSTHKIVVHGGGVYGDKTAAIARWAAAWRTLPEAVRARLVLENDERLFGVDDVLQISVAANGQVPVVFDAFHHRVLEGDHTRVPAVLGQVFATWNPVRDGVPKVHFSSQAPGQRPGAHAEFVDPAEFRAFLDLVPSALGPFDCMLEAKAKDLALFRVRDALAT